MRVLFIADNAPVQAMFAPIVAKLPCQILVSDRLDYNDVRREAPDLLVLAREETTPLERKVINCGIPTLLVPHGMLMSGEASLWQGRGWSLRLSHAYRLGMQGWRKLQRGSSPLPMLKTGLFRLTTDFKQKGVLSAYTGFTKIACYGEAMREILIGYGVKPENAIITGNPKFDKYFGRNCESRGYVLLLTDYLVEFGAWSSRQRRQYVSWVCEAVAACNRETRGTLGLVVKIHPVMERLRDYAGLARRYGFELRHTEDVSDFTSHCSIAITLMSSAGMGAMAAGKPLIVFNPYGNPTPYDKGVLTTTDVAELAAALVRARTGVGDALTREAQEFVVRQAYLQDGKAAERIAGLIMEMLETIATRREQ